MKYEIGQLVIAKVDTVKPYALFMVLEDGTKGLLHISEISDSYIRDIERYGTVGDELRVKILAIDEHNGFMRFSLKQVPEQDRYSTHDNNLRHVPKVDKEIFRALEERLDGWIQETLAKARGEKKND